MAPVIYVGVFTAYSAVIEKQHKFEFSSNSNIAIYFFSF